jgi:predicted acylesterase/phospholipase RssA
MDSDDMEIDERSTAVIASASIPGIFPPTKLRDYNLIDGGSVWNLNIIGAIEKCKELGVTNDENIVLDVIIL